MVGVGYAPPSQDTSASSSDYRSHREKVRKEVMTRKSGMFNERSSWDSTCREVTDYLLPYAGRYSSSDVNQGGRRDSKIIDSSATRSARILSAAMMAYANSQAQEWFELTLGDHDLAKFKPVKTWLRLCRDQVNRVFHKSNTYRMLHKGFDEMGAFGTACNIMRPNFRTVIHHYPVTNGRFMLAENELCEIDTCYREVSMTVLQMVEMFGIENVSDPVANLYRRNVGLDERFNVIHAIEPRRSRDPRRRDGRNKAFRSVYFEEGGRSDQILSEDGFDDFPVLAPRWDTTGGDVYGNGPGIECLGHIKQLQLMKQMEAKAVEYGVEKPLQGPTSLKEKDVDRAPGGFTSVDAANPQGGIREAWKVDLDLDHLLISTQDVRQQIRDSFHTDTFAMFTGISDMTRRTKAEIDARVEEKMLLLGPVVSNVYREQHTPLITFTFMELLRGGGLPPMPEELAGQELGVEYVSALALAQKAVGISSLDRLMFVIGQLAASGKPEAWDKLNISSVIDDYADRLGVNPEHVIPGPQFAIISAKRAAAEAAKEQALMLEQQAGTAKTLSETQVGGGRTSALDAMGQTGT